jgi:tetratricopeptide (TPR) repeat protein/predicted Ser/Thr protein kinase
MSSRDVSDDLPPVSAATVPDAALVRPDDKDRAAPPPEPLPPRVGSYRVLELLGRGGMGVVYRAVQDNPPRPVALKVIRPDTTSADRLHRFEHEAKVLARLQHPGIAQIFEAGVADLGQGPQPFFAMELIQGRTLAQHAEDNYLTPREMLELFTRVCQAVEHAHQRGIIHRDLKPDNILVDAAGQPKVIDFGVARVTNAELHLTTQGTSVGQLVGTLRYMSPEQVKAEPDVLDTRSDVYTLGVICYELLTGRLPYELKGMPIPRAVQVISEAEPTPLSSVNKVFGGDLNTIVSKALEKDKARRYQSAAELAADVERYLAQQPIQARPPSAVYQLKLFARRNKALVVGIIATLLGLILGIVVTTLLAITARKAETAAKQSAAEVIENATQLAIQRGAWREALRYIDEALATDSGSNSVSLRLNRIRALLAVSEGKLAIQEIETLSRRNDLGDLEGSVLLLRADLLQGQDVLATVAMINQARAKGLSPAEDAFAQALIADSTPRAIDALRKSLAANQYQPRAQSMLCLLLLTLGRREEMRVQLGSYAALFPKDLNVRLMQALLAASDGDGPRAKALLDPLRGQIDEASLADLKTILSVMVEFCDAKKWSNPEGAPDLDPLLPPLVSVFQRRWPGVRSTSPEAVIAARTYLPLPPVVQQSFGRLVHALLKIRQGQSDEDAVAELEKLLVVHPDGTVRYVLALFHFSAGRFAKAEKEGLAAADMSSWFPIRRQALWTAATAEGMLGSPRRSDSDPQRRKMAVATLRRVLALGPVQPHEREIAVKIPLNAEELGLARQHLDEWDQQAPGELSALQLRARLELKSGAYGRAIAAANKALAMKPDDAELRKLIQEASEKLRKEADTLPKP